MSCLHPYLEAVAKRKALTKDGRINHLIVQVLEQDDIPILLEMIRAQHTAISRLIDYGEMIDDEDMDLVEIVKHQCKAFLLVEELASQGSCCKYGESDDGGCTKPGDACEACESEVSNDSNGQTKH